ncbi:hypothetical protein D3C76_927860 [compost metagenome]
MQMQALQVRRVAPGYRQNLRDFGLGKIAELMAEPAKCIGVRPTQRVFVAHTPSPPAIMFEGGGIGVRAQGMAHAPRAMCPLTLDRIVLAIDAAELLPVDDMDAFA